MTVEVTILATLVLSLLAYLTYQNSTRKNIREDASKSARLQSQLEYIINAVDEMRIDAKSNAKNMSGLEIKLTKVEESDKVAHHKIEELTHKVEELTHRTDEIAYKRNNIERER